MIMTTPRTRVIVSLLLSATVTVLSGACAANHPNASAEGVSALAAPSSSIVFDNDGREHVHVYLVSDQRQWLLGRVEPGVRATLRIPNESLARSSGQLRLAVVAGRPVSPRVTLEPRAEFTIMQPASRLLLQDWRFAQDQLVSTPIGRARAGVIRR
jgi:hypothetical protein